MTNRKTFFYRSGCSFQGCGRKLLYIVAAFLFMLFIGGTTAPKTYAASSTTPIAGVTELRDWNQKRGASSAILKDNLIIRNSVTLEAEATSWKKELEMDGYYIHIRSGGTLTINNKDFLLSGTGLMIMVDAGGTLVLREGTINGDDGETVISLKTGSTYRKSVNFNLTGNVVRSGSDESQGSEGPAQPQLLSVEEDSLSLACMEGASLSSLVLPASVKVSYLTADGKTENLSLPITWDTSGINMNAAGVYKLKGTFTEETLKKHSLTNPGQVTAALLLAVMRPEDAGTLNVRMITEDSAGNTVVRLEFPMLTSEVTALYLYTSKDGKHFERESWTRQEAGGGFSQTENFLAKSKGKVDPPWQYLEYSCRSDGQFWLQLEIVGSALAGRTNAVMCDSFEERKPGKMKDSGSISSGAGGTGGTDTGNGTGANADNGIAGGLAGGAWGAGVFGGRDDGEGGSGMIAGRVSGGNGGVTGGRVSGGNGGVTGGKISGGSGVGSTDGASLSGSSTKEMEPSQDGGQGLSGDSDAASGIGAAADDSGEGLIGGAEGGGFAAEVFHEGMEGENLLSEDENAHKTAGWKSAVAVAAAAALVMISAGVIWWFRKKKKLG